jgi:predicted DNA-binding transcriptional regulator YafY
MNRIDRLFGILTLLQGRKYVPAESLAARFGISVRTVYRDVKALCEGGIPVSFEPNRGYFIVQGYFLSPVSFSSEEANALLLMERMVNGFADKSISKHYSSALNKIRSVLKDSQKEKLEQLDSNIQFQFPSCFMNDMEYLSGLQSAISGRTSVELEYRNNNNEVSKRVVEPIGLVFYAFGWHLIGWCRMRQDYRDFKVVRILKLRNTGCPFEKKDPMRLEEYMKSLPVAY